MGRKIMNNTALVYPKNDVIKDELLIMLFEKGPLTPKVASHQLAIRFNLTEEHLEDTYDGGDNKWQSKVRAAREGLVDDGYIHPPTSIIIHGKWLITDKGVKKVEKLLLEQL